MHRVSARPQIEGGRGQQARSNSGARGHKREPPVRRNPPLDISAPARALRRHILTIKSAQPQALKASPHSARARQQQHTRLSSRSHRRPGPPPSPRRLPPRYCHARSGQHIQNGPQELHRPRAGRGAGLWCVARGRGEARGRCSLGRCVASEGQAARCTERARAGAAAGSATQSPDRPNARPLGLRARGA